MDGRRLKCFVALAEELHFSRAAERAGISQPGLSQQLRQLEAQLQVQLVYRSKRHVSLTRAGEVFLREARKILADMAQAVELTRRTDDGLIGKLRVGTAPSALFISMPEIILTFRAAFPLVDIDLQQMSTDEQVSALRNGTIDVGLMHPPLGETGLQIEQLYEHAFDVAMSDQNPLARKKQLRLTDLADETFILFPRAFGPQIYDDIIARCHKAGFSPRRIIEASPAQSIVAIAACNLGVGFVASDVQHYSRPHAIYRPLAPRGPTLRIAAGYSRTSSMPMAHQFIAAARRAHPTICA